MAPRLLLFDEPLSNLDARLREEMRIELSDLQGRLGIPVLYVTHDQAEAMALATRIAVMDEGRIAQVGTPEDVYRRPASEAVARFIGAANLVPGQVDDVSHPSRVGIRTGLGRLWVSPAHPVVMGDDVLVAIRPEHLALHDTRPEGDQTFEAVLVHTMFAGSATDCVLEAGPLRLRAQVRDAAHLRRGARMFVTVDAAGCTFVPHARGSSHPQRDELIPGKPESPCDRVE